ncbi:hypothetical protein HPB47_022616 [Ixodes persulcatus]|uniref:Uncharacterized protein n=1 Tax=Ixodes persulcatus TaxID=34615 RepID=A0AC60Q978_IXOPE|nr:hypothetical protein HPB47_022616 [Ixodes persulcatus]
MADGFLPDARSTVLTGAAGGFGYGVTKLDDVVLATGYRFKFPVLSEDVMPPVVDNEVQLYKYVFPPGLKHPTLAVIALVQPLGAIFPIAEMQVLEVARDNDKFPKISRTTLWRALVDLGFTFVKRNRDSLLMERTDLVLWRANKTFKLAEVELLTPGALQQVTPDDWKAYARHVIDVENKMWEADCLSDTVIDSVVIHLGSDDDK